MLPPLMGFCLHRCSPVGLVTPPFAAMPLPGRSRMPLDRGWVSKICHAVAATARLCPPVATIGDEDVVVCPPHLQSPHHLQLSPLAARLQPLSCLLVATAPRLDLVVEFGEEEDPITTAACRSSLSARSPPPALEDGISPTVVAAGL
ncbi:hypothetical protein ACLOJK_007477 [Asimina triloba]